jgi:hypothetical protein
MPSFYGRLSELDENNMNLTILTFEMHRNQLLNDLQNDNNKNNKQKQKILNELKSTEKLIELMRNFNIKYLSNNESS